MDAWHPGGRSDSGELSPDPWEFTSQTSRRALVDEALGPRISREPRHPCRNREAARGGGPASLPVRLRGSLLRFAVSPFRRRPRDARRGIRVAHSSSSAVPLVVETDGLAHFFTCQIIRSLPYQNIKVFRRIRAFATFRAPSTVFRSRYPEVRLLKTIYTSSTISFSASGFGWVIHCCSSVLGFRVCVYQPALRSVTRAPLLRKALS